MANAILTTTIFGAQAPAGMPRQALVAILSNGVYQLSYERNFDNLAPSLASAIVPGAALQGSPAAQPVLLASVAVDFDDDSGPQLLYTPPFEPVAFSFFLYRLDIRNVSVDLDTASISFGQNSPDYDDVISDGQYIALTGPTLYQTVFPSIGATVIPGGSNFAMLVNAPQGEAATGIIDVFAYFIEE